MSAKEVPYTKKQKQITGPFATVIINAHPNIQRSLYSANKGVPLQV
jgi:N-acetyl-anhydromuramyl-L-alanine amidase AmpD